MPKLKILQDRFKTADEKEIYIENLFSTIDDNYDFMNRFMSLGLDLSWRRKAIKAGNFSNQSLILDVATGSGDFLISAHKVIPDAKTVGLDFCRPLLLKAKEKLNHKNGSHPVNLVEANGLKLPMKDESFDGVITAFSLRNVASVDDLFSELNRITKPGGKVISLEMMKPANTFQKIIFSLYFKRLIPTLGNLLAKQAEAYNYLPLSIENFYTAKQLSKRISKAGWRKVGYKNLMFGFVAFHVGEK